MENLRVQVLERVIQWVLHKEMKLAQYKFLVKNCLASHWELQIESILLLMMDQVYIIRWLLWV